MDYSLYMRLAKLEAEPYQYTPLLKHTSIRLLTLLPGSYGTLLRCQITECEDISQTSYEALSYTWGDPVFPEFILVNPTQRQSRRQFMQFMQFIPITQNLHNALQRLRHHDTPRKFWIDALCINQHDLKEKGYQVAHMGQIYQTADHVLVWLGDDGEFPRTTARFEYYSNRVDYVASKYDNRELLTIPWYVLHRPHGTGSD